MYEHTYLKTLKNQSYTALQIKGSSTTTLTEQVL